MNTNRDNLPLDDGRLDRLVDGELSEPERRELLAGLESEPGGWRRCALAFLESQCWKQSVGALWKGDERSPHTPCADIAPAHGVRGLHSHATRWSSHLGTLAAMAACFVVAFWVGAVVRPMLRDQAGTPSRIARTLSTPQVPVASEMPGRNLMVTVAAPGDAASAGATLRVPAVERSGVDQDWLQRLPPIVPEDVMQAFNRTGHQIEQHRELVPVRLDDGRQLVMPVDQVKVHYVGNGETY